MAADLSGRQRLLERGPLTADLNDVSRDGRALITLFDWQEWTRGLLSGQKTESRLVSRMDLRFVDLSQDGKLLVLREVLSQGTQGVWIAKGDSSPPIRLGDGVAHGLSRNLIERAADVLRKLPNVWYDTSSVCESDAIDTLLGNYARAIRYVHDETVKRINQGLSLERIRAEVKLPEDLAKLPYLQPGYGTVPWSVNGIYKQYTGWYDFDPADLNPGSRVARAKALVEAAGGSAAIIARAKKESDPQVVVELLGVVIDAEPGNREARAARAAAFEMLGKAAGNTVERNVYLLAAQEDRAATSK